MDLTYSLQMTIPSDGTGPHDTEPVANLSLHNRHWQGNSAPRV